MLVLKNKIKVFIPKEDNTGKAINCSIIERSISRATDLAGGATKYDGTGYWVSAGGRLMTDNVSVVEWSYNLVELIEKGKLTSFSHMIGWIVNALITFHNQEAVSVEVDGVLCIIDKNDIADENGNTDSDRASELIKSIMKGEY